MSNLTNTLTGSSQGDSRSRKTQELVKQSSIILVFVFICVLFTFLNEYFLTWGNWLNLLRQSSINGILAIGVTFVILTKGIDLSVGSIMALAGMLAASFVTTGNEHFVGIAVAVALGTGALMGLANGVIIARINVPPFVATLGMLSMARGLTLIYSDGRPTANLSAAFRWIGSGNILGLPLPVIIFFAVFIIGWITLTKTTFGRYVYAVGGNEKAARTSGISTRTIIAATYVISGLLAGLGGLVLAARTTAALPQAGIGYELDAIAAVVIGGTSLSGGRGSLVGTLFGALIIGTINNGMDLMGVSSYYQQLLKGGIIIIAVIADQIRKN
ncbi:MULTISPECIES: ABC transporter permease [Rhizobium/Agrobacterium group]|uniref:ABC transporter permease n=1 Tax=Rhizobium/Agrobacterium group TaxID=227290 RepID=UPI0009BAEEBC|nr:MULTISPECIES: ABC transporter permease [Rhizobium/Agrobacterium group]MBB4402803.1 putative xylitol transport system permease protein [Agrobacterium radiobacter]MBB5589286.1 putative xylitol transport system permease protein [Agrobacterium radiobacter]TGE85883.1 ABC transporter permease [Rhizobium sp. SEMIA 4032]WQE43324.1 ABC transporter permease [Agrobacterium tumefaciens]CUX56094.1 ABC transporter, Membrane component (putative high-affinity D-ribose transport protein) [Agrobacterium delt